MRSPCCLCIPEWFLLGGFWDLAVYIVPLPPNVASIGSFPVLLWNGLTDCLCPLKIFHFQCGPYRIKSAYEINLLSMCLSFMTSLFFRLFPFFLISMLSVSYEGGLWVHIALPWLFSVLCPFFPFLQSEYSWDCVFLYAAVIQCTTFLQSTIMFQLIKKFTVIYGTWRFFTMFTGRESNESSTLACTLIQC
jgi:hypothetical protein